MELNQGSKPEVLNIADLQIEERVRRLQTVEGPGLRDAATELLTAVMELHTMALKRILAILYDKAHAERAYQTGEGWAAALERDALVSSVLLLHNLHSQTMEVRIQQALERLRLRIESYGAEAQLIETGVEIVRVRVHFRKHACGSTSESVRAMVLESLLAAAPDAPAAVVEIEEENHGSANFVPLEALKPAALGRGSAR